jgi:AcrR family transcriptional regulator
VVGVSPRTFNNYFPSKEAAIVWPATLRAAQLADSLAGRPPEEPLADAIVAAVAGQAGHTQIAGLPAGWLDEFRALVAAEPALHGEYLKAAAAAEPALADAIARRAAGSRLSSTRPPMAPIRLMTGPAMTLAAWLSSRGRAFRAMVKLARSGSMTPAAATTFYLWACSA